MKKLLTVSILAVAFHLTFAHNPDDTPVVINKHIGQDLLVHRAGEIELSVTNFGVLGSYGGSLYDPEANRPAPSAVYPDDSNLNYLFFGALWIGAEVEDTLNPGGLDTLVSVGDEGFYNHIHELSPADVSHKSIRRQQLIADEEIIAVYDDTKIESIIPDPADERDHRPLGVSVTQHSLAWKSKEYNEFIIINYYVENIYNRALDNVWMGIYFDNEIREMWETYYPQVNDDLCGSYIYKEHPVVWTADNDGHPYDGAYQDYSINDVLALVHVNSSTNNINFNFNWWISSDDIDYDWGPQRQTNYDIRGDFAGGGKGTPKGDKAKYRIMSNGEKDFDQAYSALNWTGNGWIEKSTADFNDIADGYDTRFLFSFGPFDLEAGDVETLTVALVAGHSLHRDPGNYEKYLLGHTDDSLYISAFYNNLDFTKLQGNIDKVLNFYNEGYDRIPPGPPEKFHVESWAVDHIVLTWNQHTHYLLGEYRIYRGIEPGVYDAVPITPEDYTDTVFVDNDVSDNTVYYYVITSVNKYDDQGDFSEEISINTGQPQTPSGLSAEAHNGGVQLEWEPNPDEDLYGYLLYGKSSAEEKFGLIDTLIFDSYSDDNLTNGVKYFYKIRAVDIYGNQSYDSKTVRAIPMAFDSGIMLINANYEGFETNPDYDSIQVFYENMLVEYPHIIVYECPDELTQLSPYSTIVWCKEIGPARIQFDNPLSNYSELFADYLDAGGQLILAGTRLIKSLPESGELPFFGYEFQYNYLNIAAVEYPEINSTEFIGGFSDNEKFPEFNIDSAKANRIVYPKENESGRLYGIGSLIPRDTSEVIYRYNSVQFDTSRFYNKPIGILHESGNYRTAVLEFPLYYIESPVSYEIMRRLLGSFGEKVPAAQIEAPIPESIELLQNFPNPFNFRTEIRYILPEESRVKLEIFDILGRSIITLVDEFQAEGLHSVTWDARSAAGVPATSGIYFYRLTAGEEETAKRMVYLK